MPVYQGPVYEEPLSVELHNTLYALRGRPVDGLADVDGLRAWLGAIANRLPVGARSVDATRLDEFVSLREAVREALHASLEQRPMSSKALATLNAASAAGPQSLRLAQRGRRRESQLHSHALTSTDAVFAAIAADAIARVGGAGAGELGACGAPGCVLLFVKDHPRREWCSTACGNRARQARHYARTRGRERRGSPTRHP